LLDCPQTDPEVQAAWQAMQSTGPIPAILAGRWRGASSFRQRTWSSLGDSQETDRWVRCMLLWF
jgi:hypothetical protein